MIWQKLLCTQVVTVNKVQLKPEILSKTEGIKRTHYFLSGLVEEERKKKAEGKLVWKEMKSGQRKTDVEEFGWVYFVHIHCSCPSSLSHAVTLPSPSLISPIGGFSSFLPCECMMSDSSAWQSSSHLHTAAGLRRTATQVSAIMSSSSQFCFLPAG